LEQLEPEAAVYNISRAVRLFGTLNSSALEASLNEIVRRHETLRTEFRLIDGQPVQVVQPSADVSIKTVDLSSLAEDKRQTEIALTITSETERPFDLSAGQLLRCTVIPGRNDDHVVILTTHHSVSDAWAIGILTRELWSVYEAFSKGNLSPLKPPPVQYSDYAVWQRAWLQGDVLESQFVYWKERLKDLPVLNFPTDRPRKPRQSFCGARLPIALSEDLTRSVNEVSDHFAVTSFMTLLAAFQVLLYRYTGQEDVVVGSPIANRRRPELEGLIGFFVNTLVLRADLSGNPSFSEFLLRVRDTCVGADANQDLPFEKLVQELQPERDQSRNPLFQVMFVLQNATRPFTGISGLRIEPIQIETTRSPFDLSLFLREREGKYIGYIEYSTDLFDRDRIERMAGHYRTLLEASVADPDQSIATLPILTEAERHQILVEWNDTAADYPKDKCIHHLLEEQVERTPDAIALEFEEQRVTYRELNQRANQLAHYLMTLGIGPEKLVGICAERSIEMVVGVLGILKAGGGYVPLDPAYPKERLWFMLKDSQVSVLLTEQKLVEGRWKIEDGDPLCSIFDPGLEIVSLDRDAQEIKHQSSNNPCPNIRPQHLAYVIYTSGSTGQPKGVVMSHRSLQNLITWQLKSLATNPTARVLQFSSLNFDVSFQEIFSTWCSGGTLVLIREELRHDPLRLLRELTQQSIERLFLPFTIVEQLAASADRGYVKSASLREIITAGEQLKITPSIRRFFDRLEGCSLHNHYGPTETHVVTSFSLKGPTVGWPYCPPIGRPIANTQTFVLDSSLQPVPIGVPGELYIAGHSLARGYFKGPQLTAEKFIFHSFTTELTTRLYKTGDRALYLPDGNIEFLGRTDNQVKIRGYRIELGEIEAVLNQHPKVKESIVVLRERDQSAEQILVSYIVPKQQSTDLTVDLRNYLNAKLPTHMIPALFVTLEALPLLPNGKVDHQKLRSSLNDSRFQVSDEFVAPRATLEELIAQTWQEILKIEKVGIYDNFFELGGHSMIAIRIISRLCDIFNKEIPVSVLFDQPTVAGLGKEIERIICEAHTPKLPPIVHVSRDGPLPLSVNQEHLWHLDQMMPGTHFFNMPYVYRLSGELNLEALEKALSEIGRRHEALRTVFGELNGSPVQIIKSLSDFQLALADWRHLARGDLIEKATARILEEKLHPFDLSTGPLIRATLLRLTDQENLLLTTVHHIIADHWSMQIFRSDLIGLYEAFYHGKSSPLPEPIIQFGDYASWERQLLDSGLFNDQFNYWQTQLARALPGLQGQVSGDSSREVSWEFNRYTIETNEVLLRAVRLLAKKENSTVFMVLLTALFTRLHISTGQRELRIGILMANRRRWESAMTIGHFANTVILNVNVSPGSELKQLLNHVREVTLRAHMYQDFPMEELMRNQESKCGIDRSSLFRILVNFQTRDAELVNLPGLTFAPWDVPNTKSEVEPLPTACDLIFNFKEMSTSLTGTVYVRSGSVYGIGAEITDDLNRILKLMVSEPNRLISQLN